MKTQPISYQRHRSLLKLLATSSGSTIAFVAASVKSKNCWLSAGVRSIVKTEFSPVFGHGPKGIRLGEEVCGKHEL